MSKASNANIAIDLELDALVKNISRGQLKWDKQGNPERTLTFSFKDTPSQASLLYIEQEFPAIYAKMEKLAQEAGFKLSDGTTPEEIVLPSTDKLKVTVRRVLSQLAKQIGLEFIETTDIKNSDLHFFISNDVSNEDGVAFSIPTNLVFDQVLISIRDTRDDSERTVAHEIGHALGLDHPEKTYEDIDYTVMLSQPIGNSPLATFSVADIMALKNIYGPDTTNTEIEDLPQGQILPPFIRGTENADTIKGTTGKDFIAGRAGNDIISGDEGDDILIGGEGYDTLMGNEGDDTLFGGNGNDILLGGDGYDLLVGDDGNDLLVGDDGGDTLRGGKGNDNLWGGEGYDTLIGDEGSDTYLFRRGDKGDIIDSEGNREDDSDTLQLGEDIAKEEVLFERNKQDLVVRIANTTDYMIVNNYYVQDANTIKHIVLHDGQEIDLSAINLLTEAMAAFTSESDNKGGSTQNYLPTPPIFVPTVLANNSGA